MGAPGRRRAASAFRLESLEARTLLSAQPEPSLKQVMPATDPLWHHVTAAPGQPIGPKAPATGAGVDKPDAGAGKPDDPSAFRFFLDDNGFLANHSGLFSPPQLAQIGASFDGLSVADTQTTGYTVVPPQDSVAVGPNQVVQADSWMLSFFDKAGNRLGAATSLGQFFAPVGGSLFEFNAQVTYDAGAGRFILATEDYNNFNGGFFLNIAVSNDSNPMDGFTEEQRIDASEGGLFSGGAMKLGYNHDAVVASINMYSVATGGFDHVQVVSLDKSTLTDANPGTLAYDQVDRTAADYGLAPATIANGPAGGPEYFVEENTYGDGQNLRVVRMDNVLSASPTFTDTVVKVDQYTEPPVANQPGGSQVRTGDSSIQNAQVVGNELVAAQTVGLNADHDAHVRWYQLDLSSGTPSFVQDGTIAPTAGTSTFDPAIALAGNGDLGLSYVASSANQDPSMFITGRGATDPAGMLQAPVEAKAAVAPYADFTGSPYAFGDYSGIAVDPSAANTFWASNEYANGATGGQANWGTWIASFQIGLQVSYSIPAAGSVVTGAAPVDFVLHFSDPIDPASIVAKDFTVDGISASSYTLTDPSTITYHFKTSPVVQGADAMALPAGAVKRLDDGSPVAAFSATFDYAKLQLQVVSTSPASGSVVTLPFTDLVVHFNTAIDPYTVNTSNLVLSQGTVVKATVLDPKDVDYTLAGVTQDGTLSYSIPAGALTDPFGVPNLAYSGSFITDVTTVPYPTPLTALPPAGSLIYDPSASGTIGFKGDTDSYTLSLAASQTLSVTLQAGSTLTGVIAVIGPDGRLIASATVPSSGETVVLQTAPVTAAGTYTIVVGGAGGTTGAYTIQAILNAAVKLASGTNTGLGSAYNLTPAFASLGTSPPASRAGVIGTFDAAGDGDYYGFYLAKGQSATVAAKGTSGGPVTVELLDASGNVLALGTVAQNVDESVNNFVAPKSGAYYVLVLGAAGASYSLVVTRGADFEIGPNGDLNHAQPLDGVNVVLGAIVQGGGSLFALDDNVSGGRSTIYQVDSTTGALSHPIPAPNFEANNPFGLNMAFDGTYLYYNDGANFGSNTIHKLDPATGNVLASFVPPSSVPLLTGLAWLNGNLYATDAFDSSGNLANQIFEFSGTTFSLINTFSTGITSGTVEGLAGDPGRGVLWAVTQGGGVPGSLFEIDPATGNVLKSGPDSTPAGLNEQDLAFANGDLYVSATNGLGSAGGTNELDVYDPNTLALLNRLPANVQGFISGLGGDGVGGQDSGWYSFGANAGDTLVLDTTTPGGVGGSAYQFNNYLNPEIVLFDPNGNPVAMDAGSAADGRNDHLTFTATMSGTYYVEVIAADKTSLGEYTLSVKGAAAGAPAFDVVSTSPAAGVDLPYQPTTLTVQFNDSILLTTLQATDLTIDGVPATGFTVVDSHDVTFDLPALGNGTHVVSIAAGAIDDIHGTPLAAFGSTFTTDTVAPIIVAVSSEEGAVLPAGSFSYVVTFDKPMIESTANAADIQLVGLFRGASYAPSSLSWDSTGTILTISYANLPDDSYTLTLLSAPGQFEDLATMYLDGEPHTPRPPSVPTGDGVEGGNYFVDFSLVAGASAFPKPLTGEPPAGSLIYDGSVQHVVTGPGDSDSTTLNLDPHQTLTLVVHPSTSSFQPTITLTDSNGVVVATVTAPAPGADAVLQTIPIAGGTYTITVTGASSTAGLYTLRAILNAAVELEDHGGPSDDTIATAQPIDASSIPLGPGLGDRLAALGTIRGGLQEGDAFVVESNGGLGGVVAVIDQTGKIVERITSPAFSNLILFDVHLGQDNTLYVLGDENFYTGVIVHLTLNGGLIGTVTLPTDSSGFLSPEGFGLDPRDASFWVPLTNSGGLYHIDPSGNVLASYFVGGNPNEAAVGPDGDVYVTQPSFGTVQQVDPATGNVTTFIGGLGIPLNLHWTAAGTLWVGSLFTGPQLFDGSGNLLQTIFDFGAVAAESDMNGNVWDTNISSFTANRFDPAGNFQFGTPITAFQPGLAVLGGDNFGAPNVPPPDSVDDYSFHLNAGQDATIAIKGIAGGHAQFALEDAAGNVLALSGPGGSNVDASINNFVARTAGTYYLVVTGDPGVSYSIVVTRGATFDTAPGGSFATAQQLDATGTALGAISKGTTLLYALDDNVSGGPSTIYQVDPTTGALSHPIPAPNPEANNPFGLNMAFDGTYLYYNDGANFGSNTIYKLDPATGAIITSFVPPSSVPLLTGLAWLDGNLYATDGVDNKIFVFDGTTFALVNVLSTGITSSFLDGLAGDPADGVLFAVGQTTGVGVLYEIDPATGNVLKSGPDANQGLNEQDLAYQGGELFVSDTNGLGASGGTNVIDVYTASTFAFERRMPVAVQGFVSGLGGDGVGAQPNSTDYYQFNAVAGASLVITTTTPFGEPQFPGDPTNGLAPEIELFDPSGNLVASNIGGAPDGKNDLLTYTALVGGSYRVAILGVNGTKGDYTLNVSGNSDAKYAFVVASTSPAAGALIQPPTTFTVTFNHAIYLPSLDASDLIIDGMAATGFTVDSANTVTWTLPALPQGNRVKNTVVILGGTIQDVTGQGVSGFTTTFVTDSVAPTVVFSRIQPGQVLPAGNLTETIHFSEPMNTSFTTDASFDLHGDDRGVDYTPASFSWNASGTELILNYTGLPDDFYTLTLFAGGFQDLVGHPLAADFVLNFALALGTASFPTPLAPDAPAGSLIEEGSATHVIVSPTDADRLTLGIAAGQTLTVVVYPVSPGLQPTVEVLGPNNGHLIAAMTAAGPGSDAVIETIAITHAGLYTILVGGASGTEGEYSVRAILNAAVELEDFGGPSDDSIATAQNIDASAIPLAGVADRVAVLGTIAGPSDPADFYALTLAKGQSATVVVAGITGGQAQIMMFDANGNVVATGVSGATNVDQDIENYVAPAAGTYYVEVTGTPGVQYSLVVTRGATFDLQPNGTPQQAQPVTGTHGVLGSIAVGSGAKVGTSFEGIDFNNSNCGCLPPDTNAAVGPNEIVETVNSSLSIYDKSGNVLLAEPFTQFFAGLNPVSFSDPYVEYDDIAQRWYIVILDTGNPSMLFAVSNDSNPLDGFSAQHRFQINGGDALDFEKMGYNADEVVLSVNDFSQGANPALVTIDKSTIMQGAASTFVGYTSFPETQFRALVPAQMHGAKPGDPMWLVSTDGSVSSGFDSTTIRVTEMTNGLSNSPVFTLTSLAVNPFRQPPGFVDQPGAPGSVAANDATTTQVDFRNGKLVTAMTVSEPGDNYATARVRWYQIDVSTGSPTLVQQGTISPGPGVSTYFGSIAQDKFGDLGLTYMESSSSEYVSMYIAGQSAGSPAGVLTPGIAAMPGQGFMPDSFREGDYSSVAVDPSDGLTFWAANEYSGANAFSDIWNTHIVSFNLLPPVVDNWYSVDVGAGNSITLTTSTPGDGPLGVGNVLSLEIELFDPLGNLVATGTKLADGRNETLTFKAAITGQYKILVQNDTTKGGDYFLKVATAAAPSGVVSGQVFQDVNGDGSQDPGDGGLDGFTVELLDASNTVVAEEVTFGGGFFSFGGLAAGTYTVEEVLPSGWVQTVPGSPSSPGVYTVTVAPNGVVAGLAFGDFQTVTIGGEVFDDLDGSGVQNPLDPGLSGFTVELLDANGGVVATTTTDANGDYAFANVGPGTFTVEELVPTGWLLTFPAPPGTYVVTTSSGQNVAGENFGDFQFVTYGGEVYNDLNGNGTLDPGDPGLQGWTVDLLNSLGAVIAYTTTDANGAFSFPDLGPGTYTVQEVRQSGWYQTQPVAGGSYTITASSGTNPAIDFGNFKLVSISGTVYDDLNGDGAREPGEPGLAGWIVGLLDSSGNLVTFTTTDASGHYAFKNLYPATFIVGELVKPGWVQTAPASPGYYTVTTSSGTDVAGDDFGDHFTGPAPRAGASGFVPAAGRTSDVANAGLVTPDQLAATPVAVTPGTVKIAGVTHSGPIRVQSLDGSRSTSSRPAQLVDASLVGGLDFDDVIGLLASDVVGARKRRA